MFDKCKVGNELLGRCRERENMLRICFFATAENAVCGKISLKMGKDTFKEYDVIPLSLVNSDSGMAEVKFRSGNDEFVTVGGLYDHNMGQIQVHFSEEEPELLEVIIILK